MAAIFLWLHTEGGKLKHRNAVLQVETFKLKLESFHSFFSNWKKNGWPKENSDFKVKQLTVDNGI